VGGYDYEKGGNFARQWEVNTGKELAPLPLDKGIRSVAYSPDGATIAIGGESGRVPSVMLIETATGKGRLKIPFPGASGVRSITFSPDGKTLAASGGSSTRLFDAATGRERVKIDGRAIGLRFSPDGATLVGAVAGTVYRWDAATGQSLIPEGGDSPVAQIAVTADGKRIVTRGQDGDAHVWDARTGEHQRRVNVRWQRGLALSPDGRFLVWPEADEAIEFPSADRPGTTRTGSRLRMMDVAAGTPVERFGSFEGDAHDVSFTPDGKSLVTAERYGREAAVRVWDVATGKVARAFAARWKPEGRVWRTRLSPDGKVLAVSYQGETRGELVESEVKLWDVASGKEVAGPPPHWFNPEVMAVAPDGKAMAVAPPPFGMTVQFQDVATGQVRGEFRGPRDRVTALAFGPDGQLFTGALDGTVLAWPPRAANPPADRK
jgi:WD40 repeat protein